jgi:hypothetical protein
MYKVKLPHNFLIALEEVWEDPPLPCVDADHPAMTSPDWPPPSELDQAVYRIVHDRYRRKDLRLRKLLYDYGFSSTEIGPAIKDLLSVQWQGTRGLRRCIKIV